MARKSTVTGLSKKGERKPQFYIVDQSKKMGRPNNPVFFEGEPSRKFALYIDMQIGRIDRHANLIDNRTDFLSALDFLFDRMLSAKRIGFYEQELWAINEITKGEAKKLFGRIEAETWDFCKSIGQTLLGNDRSRARRSALAYAHACREIARWAKQHKTLALCREMPKAELRKQFRIVR